jgi:carboxylate-amine ligase
VRRILETGTGADRQLRVYADSDGDLKKVVAYMAEETKAGL